MSNHRLAALVEINLNLASERDHEQLLSNLCPAARNLLGAQYAVLAGRPRESDGEIYLVTSGMDAATVSSLGRPELLDGVVGSAFVERRSRRLKNPQAAGLPSHHPPVRSLLVAPIVSPAHAYGWICLTNKIGADEFSAEDEQLLGILAAQVGQTYENGRLHSDVRRYAGRLEAEITERVEAEYRIRRLNRVYAMLSGINTLIVRVRDRESLFRETCRTAVEAGAFKMAWIGVVDPQTLDGKVVAWHGGEEGYVDKIRLTAREGTADSDRPACRALRQSQPVICNNISTDASLGELRDELLRRGHRSLGCFPLTMAGRPTAVIALFAGDPNAFDA